MANTSLIGLTLPATGTLSGQWGATINNAISEILDVAVAGTQTISTDADITLTVTTGTYATTGLTGNSSQYAVILWTASGTTTRTITVPAQSKTYVVINKTSGTQSIIIKGAGTTSPNNGVTVAAGTKAFVAWNGSDFVSVGGGAGGISYVSKTTTYTAQNGEGVLANTSGGAFTVNLPATPTVGDQVVVADSNGTWGTNNLTVGRNGSTIASSATDLVCDINGASVQLVYDGTTWDVYAQIGGNGGTAVTLDGTQTLTNKTISGASNTLSNISLTTAVTGVLPVANGGTGSFTLAGANIPVTNAANTFSATQTLSGSASTLATVLTNAAEVATVSATAATGTIAYYPSSQSVLYYTTNASANWTVNLAFSAGTSMNTALSTGQSITVAFLVTQGSTAYYNSAVQVDGTTSGVTTKWQGGTAPTSGNASSIDVYTYTVIKTGSAAFTVLASQTKFA